MAWTPEQQQACGLTDERDATDLLRDGPLFWFAHWPTGNVPKVGSVVYTVWDRDGTFVYAGMSGRTPTQSGSGPWGRLNSHASGRRSGDQFCVYVCDRLVIPSLHNRLEDLRSGALSLDRETKAYIRQRLGFRWLAVDGPVSAFALEKTIRGGAKQMGRPLLNPLQ